MAEIIPFPVKPRLQFVIVETRQYSLVTSTFEEAREFFDNAELEDIWALPEYAPSEHLLRASERIAIEDIPDDAA